jgi:hypothetical protein
MGICVFVDKKRGEIVHTHAKCVLGSNEPVPCTEDELAEVARGFPSGDSLVAHAAPREFDPRLRNMRLEFDRDNQKAVMRPVDKTPRRKRDGGR